jgi:transposase-like protein
MTTKGGILAALKALESAEIINYSAIAKEYDVNRSTLSRRHRKITRSREEYISNDC